MLGVPFGFGLLAFALATRREETFRVGPRRARPGGDRRRRGREIIVPNSNLVSNQMTNWTRSDRLRRVDVDVGVAYGTDHQEVFRVLERGDTSVLDTLREADIRIPFPQRDLHVRSLDPKVKDALTEL